MTKSEKVDRVAEILATLPDEDIIRLHNEFCYADGVLEKIIYEALDFEEFCEVEDLICTDVADIVYNSLPGFNPNDNWFYAVQTGRGRSEMVLRSFNKLTDLNAPFSLRRAVAYYIVDNKIDCDRADLAEIVNS